MSQPDFSARKWEEKLLQLARDLVRHGHGELSFSSTVVKGGRRMIQIDSGRKYVFFEPEPLTKAAVAAQD